jgi:hypothetical protein
MLKVVARCIFAGCPMCIGIAIIVAARKEYKLKVCN